MAATAPRNRSIVLGLILFLLVGPFSSGSAQPVRDSTRGDTLHLRGRLEPLLDTFGATDRSSAQLAEQVATRADNPLDLNAASAQELSFLPGLSVGLAYRIVRHRETNGPFERLAELHAVEGITTETVRAVRPFLRVDSPTTPPGPLPSLETMVSNLKLDVIQRFTRRLDLGRGHEEGRFLGSPGRLTTRLRLQYERHVQLALTLDKDPGEPLRWSPSTDTYGFDHVVGSAVLRDVGPLETLVLGDYSAQFGQGVALWQGLRFGKGRDPVSPALRSGRGLLPYRSASESGYFRGVGATFEIQDAFHLTAFASRRSLDATIDSSFVVEKPPEAPLPVRTLSRGGQHRTPREVARKGTVGETTVGGAVEYRSPSVQVGVVGYQTRFDRPLRPGDSPYRRFRVSGRKTSMMSVYGTAHLEDYLLFGEIARAPTATYGGTAGLALDRGEDLQAILLGRYYPRDLANLRGNAFGERSGAQNELGVYTGIRIRVAEKWRVGAYFDQFRFPWIRFHVPAPSTGWEARVVLEYDPRPWLSTYLQLRGQGDEKGTDHSGPGGRTLEGLQTERRYSARWHTEYAFSDALTLRTRLEVARHSTPETSANGVFLSQGLRLEPTSSLQVDARVAFFDTDGYAARIYAYEHDLLYSFSVPVFFDRGRRSYVLAQYELTSSLTLEAKYGVTRYAHRPTIGSGLNQVEGPRRRELRFQVRWEL